MTVYRVWKIAGVLLTATLGTAGGRTQETRSPLPYIAAPPPNAGSSAASGAAPIVEQPPARFRLGPPRLACWACSSNTRAYRGYYVGGGCAFCRGQPRTAAEGTWGWDYRGNWMPQRVILQWWHGRRLQSGAGAYRIDGPHPIKTLLERGERSGPP